MIRYVNEIIFFSFFSLSFLFFSFSLFSFGILCYLKTYWVYFQFVVFLWFSRRVLFFWYIIFYFKKTVFSFKYFNRDVEKLKNLETQIYDRWRFKFFLNDVILICNGISGIWTLIKYFEDTFWKYLDMSIKLIFVERIW